MNPTAPGADERRARVNLLRALNRPSTPPPAPPAPETAPAGDWWERLYDDAHDDHAGPVPKRRGRIPSLRKPPAATVEPPAAVEEWVETTDPDDPARGPRTRYVPIPSTRIHTLYTGLEPRARWAIYTGTAAAAGWGLGLEQLLQGLIAECGHDTGQTLPAVLVGLGLITACALIDRRTRYWWPPLAWVCRIPLASALLALALYAPGVTL
jgi:hypothetical protein